MHQLLRKGISLQRLIVLYIHHKCIHNSMERSVLKYYTFFIQSINMTFLHYKFTEPTQSQCLQAISNVFISMNKKSILAVKKSISFVLVFILITSNVDGRNAFLKEGFVLLMNCQILIKRKFLQWFEERHSFYSFVRS